MAGGFEATSFFTNPHTKTSFFTESMKRIFLGVPRGGFVQNFELNRSRILKMSGICLMLAAPKLYVFSSKMTLLPMITQFESAARPSNFGISPHRVREFSASGRILSAKKNNVNNVRTARTPVLGTRRFETSCTLRAP